MSAASVPRSVTTSSVSAPHAGTPLGWDHDASIVADAPCWHVRLGNEASTDSACAIPLSISEYYSDMDCIVDTQLWKPEELEGAKGLFNWGPPPPPSFLAPEDLAAMMTGAHAAR